MPGLRPRRRRAAGPAGTRRPRAAPTAPVARPLPPAPPPPPAVETAPPPRRFSEPVAEELPPPRVAAAPRPDPQLPLVMTVDVNRPDGSFYLSKTDIEPGQTVILRGVVQRLKLYTQPGVTLDASQLVAREVSVSGKISGDTVVRLNAPGGVVAFSNGIAGPAGEREGGPRPGRGRVPAGPPRRPAAARHRRRAGRRGDRPRGPRLTRPGGQAAEGKVNSCMFGNRR